MKDCWTTLGILPTDDTAAIRKAYLELVKTYHPDTVLTAEKKRKYTILCAEINQAYTQAIEQAKTLSAPQPEARQEPPHPVMDRDDPAVTKVFRQYTGMFMRRFGAAIMLLLFTLQFLPYVSPSLLRKPPEALRFAVGAVSTLFVVLFVFVIIFVYGVIIAGTLDLFLILLFPRKLMTRIGLGRHEDKLIWLSIIVANVTLFFFTDLIRIPNSTDRMFLVYDSIFRALAAGSLPAMFALNRLREFFRYKQVKKNAEAASAPRTA